MGDAQHTPGPWTVGEGTGYRNQIAIEPTIGCVYGAGENVKANARLVAAAPDLLEALKGVVRVADRKTVEFDAARAAIAKAST